MEDKNVIFLGGLRRSGSTVLCNILQQHPSCFCVPTDPMALLVKDILTSVVDNKIGHSLDFSVWDKGLFEFLDKGLNAWFNSLTNKPVVISKNRKWNELSHVFKQNKHIVVVRDLFYVIESIIRFQYTNYCVTPHYSNMFFASLPFKTVAERFLISDEFHLYLPHLIDLADSNPEQVLFVRYEDLLDKPTTVLDSINRFIGVDNFNYDLNNIQQQSLYEHDAVYDGEVDHITHPQLTKIKREPVVNDKWRDHLIRDDRVTWYYRYLYPEHLPDDLKNGPLTA